MYFVATIFVCLYRINRQKVAKKYSIFYRISRKLLNEKRQSEIEWASLLPKRIEHVSLFLLLLLYFHLFILVACVVAVVVFVSIFWCSTWWCGVSNSRTMAEDKNTAFQSDHIDSKWQFYVIFVWAQTTLRHTTNPPFLAHTHSYGRRFLHHLLF